MTAFLEVWGVRSKLAALVAAALLIVAGIPNAIAEVLGIVEAFPERTDAVVRINFGVRVQFLRSTFVADDSAEIIFQIISIDVPQSPVEERRLLEPTATFPGVTVTYPSNQNVTQRRILVQFSRPVKFRIRPLGNLAIDLVIPGAAKDVVKRPTPGEQVVPGIEEAGFAVRLESYSTKDARLEKPVPSEFQDYAVFSSQSLRDGKTQYEVLLGYFSTAEAAERARRRLLQRFPNAEVVSLTKRKEEALQAAAAATPAPTPESVPPAPTTPPAAPTLAAADVETRAAELMASGRKALDAGNNEAATESFNQLLILPPNRYSQEAQELIGVARERSGEIAKARAEYELYLKLFPGTEGAERVRKRLAGLEAPAAPGEPRPVERPPLRIVTGTVSQYYYGGNSKVDSAFNTPTGPGTSSFSTTDQSTLVNTADIVGRYRTSESDSRLVFRDTYQLSFLSSSSSFNRTNAAYYEYRGLQNPLSARLGRQTGLSGGLPSRFDGGILGYGIGTRWRVNIVGGVPVEYPSIDSKRYFYGANVDFEGLAGAWNGNLYFVEQRVDGILDRRAVGSEIRYFDTTRSLYALVDYDVSYDVLNTTLLQGTWQWENGTTVNILYDRRRAPTLTTTNAIFGQPTTSIDALLLTLTEDQVRQQAKDVTATATQALIGITKRLGEKWQLGGDARLTNVGALPATVVNGILIPAQPSTGDIYSFTGQLIGTALYSSRDTSILGTTYLTGPTYYGWLYSLNNRSLFGDRWSIEPSFQYYRQKDNIGLTLERWTPALRVSYRILESVSLESEFTWENSKTVGPTSSEETKRNFYYIGYRWDF